MIKHFNFWLTGTGWAEVTFANDKQSVNFPVSYLSDPLTDLFEALCRLAKKETVLEKIIFVDEPGERSLLLNRQNEGALAVEIIWSNEWEDAAIHSLKTAIKENSIYSNTDTIENLGQIICIGIDDLLRRTSLQEYKKRWHFYEFPVEKYNKLKLAIQNAD